MLCGISYVVEPFWVCCEQFFKVHYFPLIPVLELRLLYMICRMKSKLFIPLKQITAVL